MKLKTIVAAMALVSGSAFAAYPAAPMPQADNLQEKLSERNGNPYYAEPDFYKRIILSGFFQATLAASDRDAMGVNHFLPGSRAMSDLFLSRANIYIDAAINSWVRFHAAVSGFTVAGTRPTAGAFTSGYGYYDPNNYNGSRVLTEAYASVGNLAESNIYGRVGRANTRYGEYETNVNPMTLVQALTQTQADIVEVGFLDVSGFNGAVYAMRTASRGGVTRINNGGAQIGYSQEDGNTGFDLSLDWMADIQAVNYIQRLGVPLGAALLAAGPRSVGGVAFHAKGHWNQFDARVQYTKALDNFTAVAGPGRLTFNGAGAEPEAWLAEVGYTFGLFGNDDSRVAVSYQESDEAAGLLLPESRIQADWSVEVLKNTEVALHLIYDEDYSATTMAGYRFTGPGVTTGNDSFTGLVTFGTRFA